MKPIIAFLILISFTGAAQIKGNSIVETRLFPFSNVHTIKIDIYATITIDYSAEERLEITTDKNLFEHIDTEIVDGTIHFNQLKWIEPTQDIIINIGAPHLIRVDHDTHDTTRITNVNSDQLRINVAIGKVIVDGITKELKLNTETGQIDATQLSTESAYIHILGSALIKINVTDYLWAEVSNKGKLLYEQHPKNKNITIKNGGIASLSSAYEKKESTVKWISFKIKNNSSNRNHFIVRGPKADGNYFGYGFPMMPYAKRKERWSVGTKVYQKTTFGSEKLRVEITAEDEGKVVELFN